MKSWTSVITYSVFDMGSEFETKEEYIEWVKQSFWEEHGIKSVSYTHLTLPTIVSV